jgi:[protein-PII] uridylyltransferase
VAAVERQLLAALEGEIDVDARVADRSRDYQRPDRERGPSAVEIVVDESTTDTLVEVHADDEVGLLYRLAATLADLDVDVRVAKVATLGARVVDVFYVRTASGQKVVDPDTLDALRDALVERLSQ